MPTISDFFTNVLQPSWLVAGVLLLGIGGSVIVNESRFQTHVAEREIIMDKRIATLRMDMNDMESTAQASQIDMARLQEQVSHLRTTVQSIDIKLDLLVSRSNAR